MLKSGTRARVLLGTAIVGLAALVAATLPRPAPAQQPRAGIVTTVEGPVTVTRAALREPAPLKFRDEVFTQDRITTGERAVIRILLGGKAIVTARERSVLTITEIPGTSTIGLGEGGVAVAVAKERMKQGETVEIRTPNAVAAVRGTVVIAEHALPAGASDHHSTITVLQGLVQVTRVDTSGRPAGPPTNVGANQRVTVTGIGIGARPIAPPQTVPPDAARRISSDFRVSASDSTKAANTEINRLATERGMREMRSIQQDDGDRGAGRRLPAAVTPGGGAGEGRGPGGAGEGAGGGAPGSGGASTAPGGGGGLGRGALPGGGAAGGGLGAPSGSLGAPGGSITGPAGGGAGREKGPDKIKGRR